MAKVGRMVKELIVAELRSAIEKRSDFFVTGLAGLRASEADLLRKQLHNSQASLVMVQRRLGRLALEPLKLDGIDELIDGSVGVVLPRGDALAAAKVIVEFIKTHENQIMVRGGLLDGRMLSRRYIEELAKLPPRPILLAKVLATIESPIAGLVGNLEQLFNDMIWVVEQIAASQPSAASTEEGIQDKSTQKEGDTT